MDTHPKSDRPAGTLVWPILLIGVGAIFLLQNLGWLPGNAWLLLARLWPLALILLGVDLLVGRRSTVGMVVSALLALFLVGGAILLLLLAPSLPAMRSFGSQGEIETHTLQSPAAGVETARVFIDWNPGDNRLTAAAPGDPDLIEGQVDSAGDLNFVVETAGSHSNITLDDRSQAPFFFPTSGDMQWMVALNPAVVYNLSLDCGSGRHEFNLSGLQIDALSLDGGSGSVDLILPPGNYRANLDAGSGSLHMRLPEEAGVRIELSAGSGRFDPGSTMELVSGETNGDGVWETPDFADTEGQIRLTIDGGSGSISVER